MPADMFCTHGEGFSVWRKLGRTTRALERSTRRYGLPQRSWSVPCAPWRGRTAQEQPGEYEPVGRRIISAA